MNRVKIEYRKAGVTALLAVAMVAVGLLAHTLDALSLTVLFAALTAVYVHRARVSDRSTRAGCRRV